MSTSLIPAREDDTVVEPSDGPGKRLRGARQAQDLTPKDVAEELHLSLAVIESLERDDYDALPNNVFVAGYIRKYARLIGLDPEPLLAAYRTAALQTAPAHTGTTPRIGFRINTNYLIVGLAGLGVLILLGVLVFLWWQGRQPDMQTTDDEVTQETAPAAMIETVPASRIPLSPADTDAVEDEEQALSPGADMETPEDADLSALSASTTTTAEVDEEDADAATDIEETEKTEATAAATAGKVEIIFDGRCWVEVRDKQEKNQLSGTKEKGDRYVLEGEPPYSVKLGNPAVVRIMVGGKPFDLSTVSRSGRGGARFTLNPGEVP